MEVDDLIDKLLTSERMEKIADSIASRTVDKILKMRSFTDVNEEDERKQVRTEQKDKAVKISTTTKHTEIEKTTNKDEEVKNDVSNGLKLKYESFTEAYSIEKVDNTLRDKTKVKKKDKIAGSLTKSKKYLRNDNGTVEIASKYDKTRKEDLVSNKAIDYYDDQSNSRDENHGGSTESDYNNKNVDIKSTKGILGDSRVERANKPPNWYLRKEFKNEDVATQKSHTKDHTLLLTKVPRRYSSKETKNKFADDAQQSEEVAKRSFNKKRSYMRSQNEETPDNIYHQSRVEGAKVFAYEKSPSYEENLETYREADEAESTSEID